MQWPSLSLHSLCFKVYFIGYEYCHSCFLLVSICVVYLFPALFQLQESCDYLDRGQPTSSFSRKGPSTIQKIKEALGFMRNQHFEVTLQAVVVQWLERQLGVREKLATQVRWGPPLPRPVLSSGPLTKKCGDSSDRKKPLPLLQHYVPPWRDKHVLWMGQGSQC